MKAKRFLRGMALAGTVALSLTMAACGSDDGNGGIDRPAASDGKSADGDRTPGAAGASSQPETEMPEAEDSGPHNDADVAFNRMMMAHHQQAVTMVGLIDGRTENSDIIDLGKKIAESQGREIEQMSARLAAWGEDPAAPAIHESHDGHGGHGDSPEDMKGMLSDDAMKKLAEAKGPEFDRLFLEGMIEHHGGAIDMAESVIRDGENKPTRELAESIVSAQKAEIEQMKKLLDA